MRWKCRCDKCGELFTTSCWTREKCKCQQEEVETLSAEGFVEALKNFQFPEVKRIKPTLLADELVGCKPLQELSEFNLKKSREEV